MNNSDTLLYKDPYLLELLAINPRKAYGLIFNKYWVPLFRYAFGIVRNRNQAEDIVQELFIRLLEKETLENIHTDFKSYLYIAVKRDCLRYLKNKWKEVDYINLLDSVIVSTDSEATSHTTLVKELEVSLEKELTELPPRMREIFHLSRNEGLSSKQIALVLGLTDGTVRNQISRVLNILRLKL